MKNLRYILVLLAMLGLASLALSTGCGSAAPIPPAEVPSPIGVSMLDGGENIPVNSSFKYTFSRPVLTQTVDTSTFFIVKNEAQASLAKADLDESICDPSRAIDAVVTCSSNTECSLIPTVNLDYNASYTICLSTDIRYENGDSFEGVMATFTTETEGPLDLNNLNGATNVPIASEFRYRFLKEVDSATASASSFYIVAAPTSPSLNKAEVSPSVCVAENAMGAGISCTDWSCTLSPDNVLAYGTDYAICLTDDITYLTTTISSGGLEIITESAFEGFMASFMTEETPTGEQASGYTVGGSVLGLSGSLVLKNNGTDDLTVAEDGAFVFAGTLSDSSSYNVTVLTQPESQICEVADGSGIIEGDDVSDIVVTCQTFVTHYKANLAYTKNGFAVDSLFGAAAGALGDIDHDGHDDFIVGAYYTGASSAYVFSGFDGGLLYEKNGGINNFFGSSVKGKGDVNNDGYNDFIVGEIFISHFGLSYVGSAYVYSGFDGSLLYEKTGSAERDFFGQKVLIIDDVNGDDHDDFIVSADSDPGGMVDAGSAYVYSGMDGSLLYQIDGDAPGDDLGGSLALLDDIDDDGVRDLAITAIRVDKLKICSGSDGSLLYEVTGPAGSYYAGGISGIGDLNGDGVGDIIAGTGMIDRVDILSGVDGSPIFDPIEGEAAGDFFGQSVDNAGDLNDDGYDDFLVGAQSASPGGRMHAGSAYIYSGADATLLTDRLDGEMGDDEPFPGDLGDRFGMSVTGVGDINGDDLPDFIVGAHSTGNNEGTVYIYTSELIMEFLD